MTYANETPANRASLALHLRGAQDVETKYYPPGAHEYNQDGYGFVKISDDHADLTVFVHSREQATRIGNAFIILAGEFPATPKPAGRVDRRCATCGRAAHFPGSGGYHGHPYAPPLEDTPDSPGRPADLASCGHPRNEDGECGCASWPERAPMPAGE